MNIDNYRVRPGSKVKLSQINPGDKSARSGSKKKDAELLENLGHELDSLQDLLSAEQKRKIILVLQGMDASGKDGTIRKVFEHVDPQGVYVANFKAPTPDELAHDYLWRVHNVVPGKGEIAIFNRSHYEDVLIVRVHNWITPDECKRRYEQINAFEKMLAETGTIMIKCFLYISKDEQKKRLEERLADPTKQWKFRLGDLEERKLWPEYMRAYEAALSATSTDYAPWYVIPADSNTNRNIVIASILVQTLQAQKMRYPKSKENLEGVIVE
ncbi:MAG: polyphosphate kinase 2 family protein [Burkholderiales bacterium]